MDVQEFAEQYRLKSDEELLQLALDQEQLTDEARLAFRTEMSSRGISTEDVDRYRTECERLRLKEERRKELKKFDETQGRRWYGKANVEYDPETRIERFTTTTFIYFLYFPLIPVGTFRVRKKRSFWSSPTAIEKLPLDWEQVLKVWVVAAAILLGLIWLVKIALYLR